MNREDLVSVVRVRHGVAAANLVEKMAGLVSDQNLREFLVLLESLLELAVSGYITSRSVSEAFLQKVSDKIWKYYKADDDDEIPVDELLDVIEEVMDEVFDLSVA